MTALLALVVAFPWVPTAAAQEARVEGLVVDTSDEPLAGVRVVFADLQRGGSASTETDEDGTFFRRGLRISQYEIRFEKDGYHPVVLERRLRDGQNSVDVVMEPVQPAVEQPPPGPDATPEYAAGFEAFRAGEHAEAIRHLEPLAREHPDFVNAHLLMGRAHLELEHWEEAVEAYGRVVELDPEMAGARMDLGIALVRSGEPDAARPHFEAALELQPDDAEAHYNIGVVYFQANEVERAVEHLESALELAPDHARAHQALAFALARDDENEEAIVHLERYLELVPDAPDAEAMRQLIEDLRGGGGTR